MSPSISVEAVSKSYVIGTEERSDSVRHLMASLPQRTMSLFRRRTPAELASQATIHWALRDVSLNIPAGDVVAIIGRNGAGKSTLLKILARITPPTKGRIQIRGRLASLLEVGTGFHPDLTGRENVRLSGAILGMSSQEINSQFDSIVDFSGIGKFIDTPVKRYSSGMYARLAFSVAAHLTSEILLVDEVLSVGDSAFQQRCISKMHSLSEDGRTVIFVSHNLAAVRQLCRSGIFLAGGELKGHGPVNEVLAQYLVHGEEPRSTWMREEPKTAPLVCTRVAASLAGNQPSLKLRVDINFVAHNNGRPALAALDIMSHSGEVLMQALPRLTPFITLPSLDGRLSIEVSLPPLIPGVYFITVWFGPHNSETYDHIERCVQFEVMDSPTQGRTFPHASDHGYIVPESSCSLELNTNCSATEGHRSSQRGVAF